MELMENPVFLSLYARMQVMDAVLMALVKTHPKPMELLEEIEQNIALVRSVSATQAADGPIGKLADDKMSAQAEGWLDFARGQLAGE